jgi:hypothetical protein
MQRITHFLIAILLILNSPLARSADLFERYGLKRRTGAAAVLSALPEEQVISGLKEALGKGVQHAISKLGQTDGFLKDVNVRIPLPESLQKVESGLRAVGQSQMADDFITTMNRAAEQAVPKAAEILADSVSQMTVADAKSILSSTNTAATDYFRRTSETNLYSAFLPIVKKTTEETGVTAAYKNMVSKMDFGGLRELSSLGGLTKAKQSLDVDSYVTQKAMDGLFFKIGEEEKRIRENPAARTTDLLQKVFGSIK